MLYYIIVVILSISIIQMIDKLINIVGNEGIRTFQTFRPTYEMDNNIQHRTRQNQQNSSNTIITESEKSTKPENVDVMKTELNKIFFNSGNEQNISSADSIETTSINMIPNSFIESEQ